MYHFDDGVGKREKQASRGDRWVLHVGALWRGLTEGHRHDQALPYYYHHYYYRYYSLFLPLEPVLMLDHGLVPS